MLIPNPNLPANKQKQIDLWVSCFQSFSASMMRMPSLFFPPQLSRCLPNRDQAGFRWSVPLDVTRGAPWVRLVPQI